MTCQWGRNCFSKYLVSVQRIFFVLVQIDDAFGFLGVRGSAFLLSGSFRLLGRDCAIKVVPYQVSIDIPLQFGRVGAPRAFEFFVPTVHCLVRFEMTAIGGGKVARVTRASASHDCFLELLLARKYFFDIVWFIARILLKAKQNIDK